MASMQVQNFLSIVFTIGQVALAVARLQQGLLKNQISHKNMERYPIFTRKIFHVTKSRDQILHNVSDPFINHGGNRLLCKGFPFGKLSKSFPKLVVMMVRQLTMMNTWYLRRYETEDKGKTATAGERGWKEFFFWSIFDLFLIMTYQKLCEIKK